MMFLICMLCISGLLYTVQADCDPNTPKSTVQRLKEKLFCGYDKTERPGTSQFNQTKLYIMFIPRYIDFDDSKDFIQLTTLIYMSWDDNNLVWSTSDYDGIIYTPIKAENIWLPDFRILNSKIIDGSLNSQGHSVVLVKYDGRVHYATPTLLGAHCIADWTNWPFDKHVCNFTITSERHTGGELDIFHENSIEVRMHKYIHSHEWMLLEYKSFRDVEYSGEKNESEVEYEVFLTLRFTIQRHSSVLAASYIGPGIALVVFSLGLLFIEPTNSDRILIISLMLVLQSLYLQYLAYKIPSNGVTTPKIVKFFVSNLLLTGPLLLETLIVGLMFTWTSKPTWLQTVFDKINSYKVLQIILLSENDLKKPVDTTDSSNEEGLSLASNDEAGQQWKMFAGVVNRLTFLILLMFHTIIILMCFIL